MQEGPYRWIRHPMYRAVIACSLAAAWGGASRWGWLAAIVLIAVLAIKALLEERWMLDVHRNCRMFHKEGEVVTPFVIAVTDRPEPICDPVR